MYIVEANEQGITELEEIYSRAPLIFPSASDNLALFVRETLTNAVRLSSLSYGLFRDRLSPLTYYFLSFYLTSWIRVL